MKSPEIPFDPAARFVHEETGLAYEDFAAFLLREHEGTARNVSIQLLRKAGYAPHAVRAFWKAYDACPEKRSGNWRPTTHSISVFEAFRPANSEERYEAGVAAGKATGCWGPAVIHDYGAGLHTHGIGIIKSGTI